MKITLTFLALIASCFAGQAQIVTNVNIGIIGFTEAEWKGVTYSVTLTNAVRVSQGLPPLTINQIRTNQLPALLSPMLMDLARQKEQEEQAQFAAQSLRQEFIRRVLASSPQQLTNALNQLAP